MIKLMEIFMFFSIILYFILSIATFKASATTKISSCVSCHLEVTPNIVKDWHISKHSKNSINCSICHGNKHNNMKDFANIEIPTPDTCKTCHEEQVTQFNKGKHALAWGFFSCPFTTT